MAHCEGFHNFSTLPLQSGALLSLDLQQTLKKFKFHTVYLWFQSLVGHLKQLQLCCQLTDFKFKSKFEPVLLILSLLPKAVPEFSINCCECKIDSVMAELFYTILVGLTGEHKHAATQNVAHKNMEIILGISGMHQNLAQGCSQCGLLQTYTKQLQPAVGWAFDFKLKDF